MIATAQTAGSDDELVKVMSKIDKMMKPPWLCRIKHRYIREEFDNGDGVRWWWRRCRRCGRVK